MKLYIPHNRFNIEKIKHLEYSQYITNVIYSDEGIFRIKKNKKINEIRRVKIIDKQVEMIQLNHTQFPICYIDNSIEKILETVYRIPYKHIIVTEIVKKYRLRNDALVALYCIYDENNNFKNLYFELHECLKYKFVMNDIYSFLSLLN